MKQRHLRKKKDVGSIEGGQSHDDVEGDAQSTSRSNARCLGALSFDVEDVPQSTKTRSLRRGYLKLTEPKIEKSVDEEADEKLRTMKPEAVGTEIKVSGSFKPVVTRAQSPEAFHRVIMTHPFRGAMGHESKEKGDNTFMPPDTQIIEMAKEKRVRLRQAQLAPDYLPLGGTSQLLRQAFPEKDDRSSESEAEEDHMRLKFAGHLSAIPKVDKEMDLDVMEDEDAVDSFVDAQIKKGISAFGRSEIKTQTKKPMMSDVEEDIIALPMITRGHLREKLRQSRQQLENACLKQQERRMRIQASLQHTQSILQQSESDTHRLKESAEKTEQQYADVQNLRAYVGDLCLCLKEKLPFVEELEEHVYEQEAALDVTDIDRRLDALDCRLLQAAADAIVDALTQEESMDTALQNADIVMKDVETEIAQSTPEDLSIVKQRWEAARKVASEGYVIDLPVFGMESLELGNSIKEIEDAVSNVFSDAAPEFASVSAVVAQFHGLKKRHPKLYTMAYIADSLPELLGSFVRLEVLTWQPLRGTPLGLEHQAWYRALEHFGDHEEEYLVPELVKRVALPTAVKHIEACWSPYDTERTNIVAEMLREMLVYVPMEEAVMQTLLKHIRQRLKEAVASAGVSSVTGAVIRASAVVQSIMDVQYQKLLQLMRSVLCFDGLLPSEMIQEILMGVLVLEKCLPYLTAISEMEGVLQKAMKMISIIPERWMSMNPSASRQLLELLKQFRRKIDRHQGSADALDLEKLSLMIEQLEFNC